LEQSIALQENALQILTGQLPGSIPRTAVLNALAITILSPPVFPQRLSAADPMCAPLKCH